MLEIIMAVDRTNEQWVESLAEERTPQQAAALEDLHNYLRRGVYYYLSRERSDLSDRTHDELMQMAADFAQDATLRILKNLESFRGDSRFTTWAMKIATRTAISELRRARWKDFSLEKITSDGEYMAVIEQADPTSRQPVNPERASERDDVLQMIQHALDEVLTDRQRRAIELVTLRGIPMDVVADQLNTNRNALYKLLHDARKKLKAHLESQGVAMDYIMSLFE
jgi:RNA polymerase sigma-70 factor (ECF subfamily)